MYIALIFIFVRVRCKAHNGPPHIELENRHLRHCATQARPFFTIYLIGDDSDEGSASCPKRGRDGWAEAAPYYWSQTMSARMHESHHQLNPVAKLLGMASGKKKSVLVFRASRGNGWTDDGMERGMSALTAFVHTKTSLYGPLTFVRRFTLD